MNAVPGSELTKEPFRWDQRLFGIVLKVPAVPPPDFHATFIPAAEDSPIDCMCDVTGGACTCYSCGIYSILCHSSKQANTACSMWCPEELSVVNQAFSIVSPARNAKLSFTSTTCDMCNCLCRSIVCSIFSANVASVPRVDCAESAIRCCDQLRENWTRSNQYRRKQSGGQKRCQRLASGEA